MGESLSRILGNDRLGTRSRFVSRAALSRLRFRIGSRHRRRPRQARHATIAPARHGAAARPQRRHDLESLRGSRAARFDLGRSRPRHVRATATRRTARPRPLRDDDQPGAECPAPHRRRRRHCVSAGGDRRRRRNIEPARLSAAPGLAAAPRGHGHVAFLAWRNRRRGSSLHHPWRTTRAVDRASDGRFASRYRC